MSSTMNEYVEDWADAVGLGIFHTTGQVTITREGVQIGSGPTVAAACLDALDGDKAVGAQQKIHMMAALSYGADALFDALAHVWDDYGEDEEEDEDEESWGDEGSDDEIEVDRT